MHYQVPLDIRPHSHEGRRNRSALGITDVNKLGWSISVARVHQEMFERIIELAYRARVIEIPLPAPSGYEVPDRWSFVRTRHSQERFKKAVLDRQNHTCAICGTTVKDVLEVAHISRYASDARNRANPANGIGLCAFCHKAFDHGVFRISGSGRVEYRCETQPDPIAEAHVNGLMGDARLGLLRGVNRQFLHSRLAGDHT